MALGTMAQEHLHVQDLFMQLQDLHSPTTPQSYFYQYDLPHALPAYEVTAGAAVGCSEADAAAEVQVPAPAPVPASAPAPAPEPAPADQVQPQHPPHIPISLPYNSDLYMQNCNASRTMAQLHLPSPSPHKRKPSSAGTSSVFDDDDADTVSSRSSRMGADKKQNHSEIEKRRRDKMNTYISELSSMIPMCGAMARKLDKLTVLRMAVQHLRSVRGALSACPLSARPRPSLLSERELNALVLQAAHDCFLLVVGCTRGRLFYASASVTKTLHYDQAELLGQSFFDILHPKDVAKVKEQLSSSDLSPRERLIDIKTMLPVKADVAPGASRFCPGARRSFSCRIRCKLTAAAQPTVVVKEEGESPAKLRKKQSHEKKYCVVQFTGYLKSWPPSELSDTPNIPVESNEDGDAVNMSCLVAVGRRVTTLQPTPGPHPALPLRRIQYVSRHATDGKFLYVDQRVTIALGFLPQELYGTSLYEYVSGPELGAVAQTHKRTLLTRDALHTPPYSFRRKDGTTARIQTYFKPLRNPWTKDVESLIAKNTVVIDDTAGDLDPSRTSYDVYKQQADSEMQRLIDSQVESHKIGSAIAEEVLSRSSTGFSPELPPELLQDAVFSNQTSSLVDNLLDVEAEVPFRGSVPLESAVGESPPAGGGSRGQLPDVESPRADLPSLSLAIDGNGEAAMAVIMSLLEADAGLGGPVNFSGLPWPLP